MGLSALSQIVKHIYVKYSTLISKCIDISLASNYICESPEISVDICSSNVFPVNMNIFVSVRSLVLMKKASSMTKFMYNSLETLRMDKTIASGDNLMRISNIANHVNICFLILCRGNDIYQRSISYYYLHFLQIDALKKNIISFDLLNVVRLKLT